MSMRTLRSRTPLVGVAAAAVAITGVAATTAGATPTRTATTAAPTPVISLVASSKHLVVHGSTTQRAGYVTFKLTAKGSEREVQLLRPHKGQSIAKIEKEIAKAEAGSLTSLRLALKHVTLYGGIDVAKGHHGNFTVKLTKGTYYVYDDSGSKPKHAHKLTITGSVQKRTAPKTTATVRMTGGMRFTGAKVLPHHGTILVKNTSGDDQHFLLLIHVKKGTTRQTVVDYVKSGSNAAPPWALSATAGTDAIGPGKQQTFHYSLPKGTYAAVCFFPDPSTGEPHAAMGMVRIVTLK